MQLTDLCEALISYKQKRSRRDVGHDLQNHHSFIRSNKLWTSISSSQVPSPCHSTQPWFSLVDSQGSEAKALSSLSTTGPPTKIRNVSPSYRGDPLIHHIHHGMEYGTRMYPVPYIETNPMSSRLLLSSFSSEYSFTLWIRLSHPCGKLPLWRSWSQLKFGVDAMLSSPVLRHVWEVSHESCW